MERFCTQVFFSAALWLASFFLLHAQDGGESLGGTEVVEAGFSNQPQPVASEGSRVSVSSVADSGKVAGQVFDSEKGNLLVGVNVVLEWTDAEVSELAGDVPRQMMTKTDKNGQFLFASVPVGFYSVRFIKDGYRPAVLRDLEVISGDTTRADFPLPSAPQQTEGEVFQLEEFEVGADTLDDSRVMLDELRKQAAGSIDFLSSEDFSKYGATDLADVVARLPGVNVVEGKFAVVRGLGDRYNSTLVNGLPMPSPDPLRQGLQLDLFSTSIIDNIVTNKQFLPYMPSNSSGAAFELNTKAYPDEFAVWFKGGARFNSNAQGTFLRDPNAGAADLWGYGKSSRLPLGTIGLPNSQLVRPTFSLSNTGSPIGATFSVGAGDTVQVLGRNLGFLLSGSYDSSYTTDLGFQQDRYATSSVGNPPGFPRYRPDRFTPGSLFLGELPASDLRYQYTASESVVLVGALAGLSFDLDPEGTNKVSFVTLYSQSGNDFTKRLENGYLPDGFVDQATSGVFPILGRRNGYLTVQQDFINYEERNLTALQLLGEHLVEELDGLQIYWGATYAKTSSDIPDQTEFNYLYDTGLGPGGNVGYFTTDDPDFEMDTLRQLWQAIDEVQYAARADVEYEWEWYNDLTSKLRMGFYYEDARRESGNNSIVFRQSTPNGQFYTSPVATQDALYLTLLQPGASRPTSDSGTASTSRKIRAGHATMTFPILENLKIDGGARFEKLNMTAIGGFTRGILSLQQLLDQPIPGLRDPVTGEFITNGELIGFTDASEPGNIDELLIMPAVAVTYEPFENFTLRGGWSRTYARPSFRELSPYLSTDLQTGDLILGNPNLQLSEVTSWDLRAEFRFLESGLLAASVFYKDVDQPIEQIIINDRVTGQPFRSFFNNPDRAIVKGFEIEARSGLDVFHKSLEDFSLGVNWTMVDATVAYPENVFLTYFFFRTIGGEQVPFGPFVGTDGPPYGNGNVPQERRLFDQPEWIVNADVSYNNPDLGTSVTLAIYAQSDVLSAVGSGNQNRARGSVDQFVDTFYQLDLTLQQNITENLILKFSVKNITDTPRAIIYSNQLLANRTERLTYNVGRDYRFALEYKF